MTLDRETLVLREQLENARMRIRELEAELGRYSEYHGARERFREVSSGATLLGEIPAKCRTKSVVRARWTGWLALRLEGLSWSEIGRVTGHDHTTVMVGVRKLVQSAERDESERTRLCSTLGVKWERIAALLERRAA